MSDIELEQQINEFISGTREALTYTIPLNDLLKYSNDFGVALSIEAGKRLNKLDIATNAIESTQIYRNKKSYRRAIVHFASNVAGGAVIVVGVVGGIMSGQAEVVALTIIMADKIPTTIEDITNNLIDFLESTLKTLWQTTHDFLIRTFIDPINYQIMQWTPNPLAPFSSFGHNKTDISFEYAYAIFRHTDYYQSSISTPTYAYNTYTQERINALSQGFSHIASDIPIYSGVIEDSYTSHCFDTLLYRELKSVYKDYIAYKPIPLGDTYKIGNIIAFYLQRIPQEDIESLTPNSPLHLLKALYFCEDYILLDSNKEPLLTESNWGEFYSYKSDFYIIFIADKKTLTKEYIDKRKELYKAIIQIRKQIQEKEIQDLQKQQRELGKTLQGLDSKQRETKLQELQREQEGILRENIRISQLSYEEYTQEQERQRQARLFNMQNLANAYHTNNTKNPSTNNNAYITKDSYLILESHDNNTKIIFLDSLKDLKVNTKATFTNSQDFNILTSNTTLSFSNLIVQYNNKVTIFAKDESIIDSKQIEQNFKLDVSTLPCDVYFYSLLLRGGKEDIDKLRFFYGEKGEVYKSDESDNIEVFYNNARLYMTNYYYHAYS